MSYRTITRAFYERAQKLLAPRLVYSQRLYEQALTEHAHGGVKWADLGCGHHVLPAWRHESERRMIERAHVVGVDAHLASLRSHRTIHRLVQADVGVLPFSDDTFDLVTLNMVAEHLDHPERQFAEVRRVLRPGGTLLVHTAHAWGYMTLLTRCVPAAMRRWLAGLLDGRPAEDVFPAYYRANSRRRLARLAAAAGLDLEEVSLETTSALFAVLPPVVILELLWLRLLMTRPLRPLRTNLIVVLRKPSRAGFTVSRSAAIASPAA